MPRSPFKQSEPSEPKIPHTPMKLTTAAMRGVIPKRHRHKGDEEEPQTTLPQGPSFVSTSWEDSLDPILTRPSISQIAMGLHLSHTPQGRRRKSPPVEDTSPPKSKPIQPPRPHRPSSLPTPAPTRSALKKSAVVTTPSLTTSSSCSSSNAISTPTSARSLNSFKQRMSRYLPRSPTTPTSAASSITGYASSTKKAVRFNDT